MVGENFFFHIVVLSYLETENRNFIYRIIRFQSHATLLQETYSDVRLLLETHRIKRGQGGVN